MKIEESARILDPETSKADTQEALMQSLKARIDNVRRKAP